MPMPLTILINDDVLKLEVRNTIVMSRGHPDRDPLFEQGTRSGCWQCVRCSRYTGEEATP